MSTDKVTEPSIMPQINIPALKQIVRYTCMEENEVPFIWGGSGYGKTEAIGQVAADNDYELCDIRLGQYDTVDMRGFPGVDHVKGSPTFGQTIWYSPSTMPFIGNDQWPDDKPILMVLDEANQGMPSVLGNAYQLTNERRLGEHVLKPNVRIIMIGNREIDKGISNKLPLPLCNRVIHFELIVDVEAFCEYALSVGVPRFLVAYWLFRSENVSNYNHEKPQKVFCTPRTWMKFVKFIMSKTMPEETKRFSCMGAVGRGVALEALGYQEIYEKVPTFKQVINDPMGTPVPREESMEYAVCVKIAGEMNSKNVKPAYQYLQRMKPMFTVLGWTLAGKRDASLMTTSEFISFGQKYRDAFSAGT